MSSVLKRTGTLQEDEVAIEEEQPQAEEEEQSQAYDAESELCKRATKSNVVQHMQLCQEFRFFPRKPSTGKAHPEACHRAGVGGSFPSNR